MYNYDPRRWNYPQTEKLLSNFQKGPWNYPFDEIVSSLGNGLFVGFKMYPPLGYKPLDPRLPYLHDKLKDGDCFYARCEREGIPILVHCSPGGMSTHEMKLYMQYDAQISSYQIKTPSSVFESGAPTDATGIAADTEDIAIQYFWDNYVHPKEWRKVLQIFPKLKLCLAHFGGDEWNKGSGSDWISEITSLTKEYPNVYTDFSCWTLESCKESFAQVLTNKQNGHLRDKILFGTDWYMKLLTPGAKSYRKFCEEFWEFFQELPDGKDLWQRFTFINPFAFYGFFDKKEGAQGDKLDNLTSALKRSKCDKYKLDDHYACIRRVQKEYDRVKNQEGK
jgi:predicted TIM-barrel fold metal-dependent hydrolase